MSETGTTRVLEGHWTKDSIRSYALLRLTVGNKLLSIDRRTVPIQTENHHESRTRDPEQMVDDQSPLDETIIERRRKRAKWYTRISKAGFGVLVGVLILVLVRGLASGLNPVVAAKMVLLPFLFVVVGLLLLLTTKHLHSINLSLLNRHREQNGYAPDQDDEPDS